MFNTREKRNKFYASKQWRELRILILNDNPLCVKCLEKDILTPAIDVDHIKPLATNGELCLDSDNLQPLCKRCHNLKTKDELTFYNKWNLYNKKWL